MNTYTPPPDLLARYARILIEFALGNGAGIKPGDVVYLQSDLDALPLAHETYRQILLHGGHPMLKIHDEGLSRIMMEEASDEQLTFFPKKHMKSLVDTIDHRIYLMAPRDPFYLKDIDPARLTLSRVSASTMKKWLFDKEDQGNMSWTLCLYGTPGLAKEAGLSVEDFWEQIAQACFLYESDPVAKWQQVDAQVRAVQERLSALPISTLHLTAKDTDLTIALGQDRKWLSGGGANIPSFEIFTSPDWRGTQGHIYFDYPLYRSGTVMKDIRLTFKDGQIVQAQAGTNEKHLHEMIKQTNPDKIGEYSLTDSDFSKINTFMANTLYDENYGGEWGNTHLAVGSSYHHAYTGDIAATTAKQWKALGFNELPEHTDIMATHDRVVEATLKDGTKKVIYAKGHFQV